MNYCDEMERKGPVVDFVKMFSEELPLFTLCEMLGVDEDDRPKVKVWMHHLELAAQFLANPWQTFFSEPMFPFRFNSVVEDMFAYGERVMADRRAQPREDLLTVIARSKLGGELLPERFLMALGYSLSSPATIRRETLYRYHTPNG